MCCLKYFTYNNGIIIGHETYHESASKQINNYDYLYKLRQSPEVTHDVD